MQSQFIDHFPTREDRTRFYLGQCAERSFVIFLKDFPINIGAVDSPFIIDPSKPVICDGHLTLSYTEDFFFALCSLEERLPFSGIMRQFLRSAYWRIKLRLRRSRFLHRGITLHETCYQGSAYCGARYLVQFGDMLSRQESPTIVKARSSGDNQSVIFLLGVDRHWKFWEHVDQSDVVWSRKNKCCVFRGAATGKADKTNIRYQLVSRYFESHDVGFSELVMGRDDWAHFLRPQLSIEEQLAHRYIVTLEGNDVATNLKWILYSNSVPVMPEPTVSTWLMEEKLIPYVHYVPLRNDVSDLEQQLEWCEIHPLKCQEIAANGRSWMKHFRDKREEPRVLEAVLSGYLGAVDFK